MEADFHRALLPEVLDDLRALADIDDNLIDAALQAVTDLAARRKIGKQLGDRNVSGDLTGTRRLRFDLPGQRPERFRIVYRLQPDEQRPDTIEVIAIGPRGGHTAYQAAAERLNPTDTDP